MSRYTQPGWLLEFYDADKPFASVEDLVPGSGDLLARARRNGAREGTPYFLAPDGRADARINLFWRDRRVRAMAESTLRRYAHSLKVWLNFLEAYGVSWDQADADVLGAFKEWRMNAEENDKLVQGGSFKNDLKALNRFYRWVSVTFPGVENPVLSVQVGETFFGEPIERLEVSPSAVRNTDVKWLSSGGYRQWRDIGLRGFTREGLPADSWRGVNEDRDTAYADGLYGTGLRNGEWSSVLTIEVPQPGTRRRLYRCDLAGKCAKGKISRPYWMPVKDAKAVRFYLEEGSRPAAVARAQRAGRYDRIRDKWLLESVKANETLVFVDENGEAHETTLDRLTPRRRMRLFRQTDAGLEPLWLWLHHDGRPRGKKAWNHLFDRANQRVARALGTDPTGRCPLFARPHMMRHSFALHWFSVFQFVKWERTSGLTEAERRDHRKELGEVWRTLATLLGHASPQVTESVYLEPFVALDFEQIIGLMDGEELEAVKTLVDVVAGASPRVLSEVSA